MIDQKIRRWWMYAEIFLHLCYWTFHFTSVNTNWDADWTDRAARNGIAQLTIVLYPIIFYLNAFWLIPRFLKGNNWYRYFAISFLLVLLLEVCRTFVFVFLEGSHGSFEGALFDEFISHDNLIFGLPNSLFFASLFSTVYRFTRDWVINQRVITELQVEKLHMIEKLEELEKAVNSQQVVNQEELAQKLSDIFSRQAKPYRQAFQGKRRGDTYLLRTGSIVCLKAQGDFVLAIDDQANTYVVNYTLSVMEELLDPLHFHRINRSEMVNASFILKYSNHTKNRLAVHLKDIEEVLYTSNSRTPGFRKWLEEW